MKKILLVLSLSLIMVLAFAAYASADNNISLGYGFSGKIGVSGTDVDTNGGLEIGYQYTVSQDQMAYGFGIDYQFERELTNATAAKFSSIPVYGVFKYNFTDGDTVPYLTARLGYNFFSANDSYKGVGNSVNGGLYYGVGFGVKIQQQFNAELLYSVGHGSRTVGSTTTEGDYKVLGVKFGFNF